jgi:hypothetical protein
MRLSGASQWLLRAGTGLTLAFLYLPLIVIAIYALNSTRVQKWPPAGLTFSWFDKALHNPGVRDALLTSVKAGLGATFVALILGTLASIAVARYRFFGREAVSFLVILPIALPGIVTGMALNSTFTQVLGVSLGLFTIIIGHATFCIVVVFNQRRRAPAPDVALIRGSLGGPRSDRPADVPLRRLPPAALGAGRRGPAGLRPELRRDHRHDLHGRPAGDAADLDLRQPLAPTAAADRQRRRRAGHPALAHPGVDRPADHGRPAHGRSGPGRGRR